MSHFSRGMTVIVVALIVSAGPVRAFGAGRNYGNAYGAAMAQARKNYQDQMKQQAAQQKEIDLAEQKAAAADAAEERRIQGLRAKAARTRHEREARYREATIAKRKAENAAKETLEHAKDLPDPKSTSPKNP